MQRFFDSTEPTLVRVSLRMTGFIFLTDAVLRVLDRGELSRFNFVPIPS